MWQDEYPDEISWYHLVTIERDDYRDIGPEQKASYLSDITDDEIKKFVSFISEQNDNKPVGKYLDEMTSEMFYEYCSMGYKANNYEHLKGLTAKEQYYKMADGRDNGLSEIDGDSPSEFADWLNDLQHHGGHPWEE